MVCEKAANLFGRFNLGAPLLSFSEPQVVFMGYTPAGQVQEVQIACPTLEIQPIVFSADPKGRANLSCLLGDLRCPPASTAKSLNELWQLILEYSPWLVYFRIEEETVSPSSSTAPAHQGREDICHTGLRPTLVANRCQTKS